jgi:hypothetical protein
MSNDSDQAWQGHALLDPQPADQYPKHVIASLARMAQAGEPLPGAVQQLC